MMAMFAIVAVFSSCSDDGYWDQYVEPQSEGADPAKYSFAQAKSVNSLDASETSVTLMVTRTEKSQAATLPIKATVSDDKLTTPESVSFEAGKTSAEYTITFKDLVIGETYTVDLAIDSAQVSTIGNEKCTVTIKLNYTWVSLGKGGFEDNFLIGGPYEVEILKAEGFDVYRVMHPYEEGFADCLAAGDFEADEIGKPTEYIEFEVDEDGLVFYEDFETGFLYSGTYSVAGVHPYYFYDDAAAFAHNCEIEDGIFQLAPVYWMDSYGSSGNGWNYSQNDGVILIYLPGHVPAE